MTKCTVLVKMQNILDFEKQTSVSVTVIVENKDGGKLVEVFEVIIKNENEAPKVRSGYIANTARYASFLVLLNLFEEKKNLHKCA